MSRDEQEAAIIRPPRKGECRQLAGTASTQVFAVPADWPGKKVRFEAIGDDFWVQFSNSAAIAITAAAFDTIAGGVLSAPNNAIGEKITRGTYKEFDIFGGTDTHCGFVGTGTAGLLAFRPAEVTLSNV